MVFQKSWVLQIFRVISSVSQSFFSGSVSRFLFFHKAVSESRFFARLKKVSKSRFFFVFVFINDVSPS